MRHSRGLMVVDDLSFSYEGGESIFSSFSLSLERGEHLLVLSPPGRGKSTLAKILTGSVPAYSDGKLSGQITVDGKDLLSIPIPERMEIVSRISQNTDEMLLFSTVEEEIIFPLSNMGLPWPEIERRMAENLQRFSLTNLRQASPSQLSGGEKRRLMLAVLFAIDPDIYILDESFDELSPEWREKLASMLSALDKSVIVLGSHELAEYSGIFNRTVSIKDGMCAEYTGEDMPHISFSECTSEHVITGDGIRLERRHRGMKESNPFVLSADGFSLKSGTVSVLLGENGSGKSTFAKVLCGLVREEQGAVAIDGKELSYKERRHKVAYLMQNPYQQLFLPTVLDELKSTGADDSAIDDVLRRFGLRPECYVSELSYGKAKLLQAAVFLLLRRPFAIFDELDSALDYESTFKAVEAYLEIGTGLLIITHDRKFASALPGMKLRAEGGQILGY